MSSLDLQARATLIHIDPLIRLILTLLKSPSLSSRQSLCDALEHLDEEIRHLDSDVLQVLWSVVTFPPLKILQTVGKPASLWIDSMEASMDRKCVAKACVLLQGAILPKKAISLNQTQTHDIIMSLTLPLPSTDHIQSLRSSKTALDKGSECCQALFSTLITACEIPLVSSRLPRINNIMARLVDSILGVSTGASLDLLKKLLTNVPRAEEWKQLFPGTFSGVCAASLRNKNPLETRIKAMDTLVLLLELCTPFESTSSRSAMLALLTLESNTSDSQSRVSQSTYEKEFARRVPEPLNAVLDSATRHQSSEVRIRASQLALALHRIDPGSIKPIDQLLILSNDTMPGVQAAARKVLAEYGGSTLTKDAAYNRVRSCIMELPALAQSPEQSKIMSILSLICGYVEWMGSLERSSTREIRKLLTRDKDLWKSLSTILDSEFSSSSVTSVVLVIGEQPPEPSNRYLSKETADAVFEMVRLLGHFLGTNSSVMVIDQIITKIVQSLSKKSHTNQLLFGRGQIEWLHRHVGSLRVAMALVAGSGEKHRDVLHRFTKSIFPLLVSDCVWNLPVTYVPTTDSKTNETTTLLLEATMTTCLRGNTILLYYSIRLMLHIVSCLGEAALDAVAVVLYPLLERSSKSSNQLLQSMSMNALEAISISCGYSGLRDLVVGNVEVISGDMMGKLRFVNHRYMHLAAHDAIIIDVSSAYTQLMKFGSAQCETMSLCNEVSPSTMLRTQHVLLEILDRLDLLIAGVGGVQQTRTIACVLESSLENLSVWSALISKKTEDHTEPWMTLLNDYRRATAPDHNRSKEGKDHIPGIQSILGTSEINLISRIISRCCYLLSHDDLMIQVKAVQGVEYGLQFLVRLSFIWPDREDEMNGPKTAILRQTADSWNPVNARLASVVESVCAIGKDARSLSLSLTEETRISQSGPEMGNFRLLFAKLLQLTFTMAGAAGDFFLTRFEQQVLPIIARVVKIYLPKINQGERFLDSEREILRQLFRGIAGSFSNDEFATAVSGLVSSIGGMLLPFLGCDDDLIRDDCIGAFRSLLRADTDALFRQLVGIGGGQLPLHSLKSASFNKNKSNFAGSPSTRAVTAARHLVEFIESLTEINLE